MKLNTHLIAMVAGLFLSFGCASSGHVDVGVGVDVPVYYPEPYPYWAYPHYPYYHRHYYRPPVVIVPAPCPPPVVVVPSPRPPVVIVPRQGPPRQHFQQAPRQEPRSANPPVPQQGPRR